MCLLRLGSTVCGDRQPEPTGSALHAGYDDTGYSVGESVRGGVGGGKTARWMRGRVQVHGNVHLLTCVLRGPHSADCSTE